MPIAIVLFGAGAWAAVQYWDWLNLVPNGQESNSTTIRNVGLIFAAVIALLLAIWRGLVADRQSKTAQESLLRDRFQKAVEMLASTVFTVRLGGIYALQGLAEQHPDQYHVQIMKQLCSFVQHPPKIEGQPTVGTGEIELGEFFGASTAQDFAAAGTVEIEVVREDIRAAMDVITACHNPNRQIKTVPHYRLDLHGADLRGVNLAAKDLSGASPNNVNGEVSIDNTNYTVIYSWATDLRGAKLNHASLYGTNLTSVDLSHASGLTQSDIDGAYADPSMPPKLNYAFDADTGEPLVWNGPERPQAS